MEDLKKDIINIINEKKMPLDQVYYILKDIFRDVEQTYYQQLTIANQQNQNHQNGGENVQEETNNENENDKVIDFPDKSIIEPENNMEV